MTEHLPECPKSGCPACYEQGQRDVFADHLEWTVAGMCKPDCLSCQRLTELITEYEKGYEHGQRDAFANAVRRVEALQVSLLDFRFNPDDPHKFRQAVLLSECIAAIKGDHP